MSKKPNLCKHPKKLIALLLACLITITLTGCDSSNKKPTGDLNLDAVYAQAGNFKVSVGDVYNKIRYNALSYVENEVYKFLYEEEINTLKIGGLFHDIGKIGVPDYILLKNSKLTYDEYSEIKNHPSIGSHILSNATIFKDVLPVVKHHHERYDGNGYPDGLSGNSIPLSVQIASLVIEYSNLINTIVPVDYERVSSLIIMESGRKFSPKIVDSFKKVMSEFEALTKVGD
jgi:response regulator RpfG family c-di-GMP phosphodiesterase